MMDHRNRSGFVFVWVIAVIGVISGFLVLNMELIAGYLKASNTTESINCKNDVKSIATTLLWEHYDYASSHEFKSIDDKDRFSRQLQWALPQDIATRNIQLNSIKGGLFLNKQLKQDIFNAAHPLDGKKGDLTTQELSFEFKKQNVSKGSALTLNAYLKEIPSSEIEFISPVVLCPKNIKIPIQVEGTSLINGISMANEGSIFRTDTLISPFVIKKPGNPNGNIVVNNESFIQHIYRFSYGSDPFKYLLPLSSAPFFEKQGYINKKNAMVIKFDGESVPQAIPGIRIESFNEGPSRLVIDLNVIKPNKTNLYILGTTDKAVNQGIVIKGNKGNAEAPLAIISNCRVWLWGNNVKKPIVVGTTTGGWTFTDDSWNPNKAITQPLSLSWKGYINSPANVTLFSSPQSEAHDGSLTIQGTFLLGGTLSGNLKAITVKQSEENEILAKVSERFLTPIYIH